MPKAPPQRDQWADARESSWPAMAATGPSWGGGAQLRCVDKQPTERLANRPERLRAKKVVFTD